MSKEALTERQSQVLKLVKAGKTATEISKTLKISPNAVHQHVRRIGEKGYDVTRPATAKKAPPVLKQAVIASTNAQPNTSEATYHRVTLDAKPTTPLEAIRARRKFILDELQTTDRVVGEARKALDGAVAANRMLAERFGPELKRLDDAEAALAPPRRKAAPKKAVKKPEAPKKPTLKEAPPAAVAA